MACIGNNTLGRGEEEKGTNCVKTACGPSHDWTLERSPRRSNLEPHAFSTTPIIFGLHGATDLELESVVNMHAQLVLQWLKHMHCSR